MATIRHTLQKEVFQPNNERLLCVCHVEKLYKKKKSSFLCIIQSTLTPYDVSIVQIKQNDKNFKRKHTWILSELKVVDGKSEDSSTQELDLHLEKIYRWSTSNLQERRQFIVELWRQCCKYLPKQKPVFKNIPQLLLTNDISTPEIKYDNSNHSLLENVDMTDADDYQAITEREESDLNKLMSGCEFAISNAEAFMDIITRDLSLLDGENVQCVLASEAQVEVLMQQMEAAIDEANKIEERLDEYDRILCHVRDTMEKMEKKNTLIEVANKNNQTLLTELENVVQQLDLDHEHQVVLVEAELTTPQGLAAAIAAGNALKSCMNCELHPALLRLAAVQEQRKRFDKLRDKFSHSISRQLNNLFIHLGNDKSEPATEELTLPHHGSIHKELAVYTELMHWTKAMDRDAYVKLRKIYTDSIGKLYERDLRAFFDQAVQRVLLGTSRGSAGGEEAIKGGGKGAGAKQGAGASLLGIDRELWPFEANAGDRQRYDNTLERVLAQLEPVCLNEQQFCVSFFQLDVISPTSRNTQTTLDAAAPEPEVMDALPHKRMARQVNEEVRRTMAELFTCLEEELLSFIAQLERQDSFYCMYVLVRLSQHVMSAQDTGSFLSMTFATALVQVKRSFDRFMQLQVDSIRDAKPPRRSKCGILPYVHNFEEFASCTEAVFRGERRADLDKWYTRVVDTMLDSIAAHSVQHHKTPSDVIKMENYHHLYALLSQLKIPVLDSQRKETKQRYTEALAAYVTLYFGRPLEKLNQFFEGVQARVASGVKISEVSYQLAFSKQELRKVIQQYPKREVKHGLENLYRKVEKHLSEEENLLQVVWRAMQEEFIRQYKHLEELIQRCYPGSMITLDFSIDNILEFFSEIAQSH